MLGTTINFVSEYLKNCPEEHLESLWNYLNVPGRSNLLIKHLKIAPLVIEKENFQLPIRSVEEYHSIMDFLNVQLKKNDKK
jgi:hypothetical protein